MAPVVRFEVGCILIEMLEETPLITVRVIVHLDNGRSLDETLELPDDIEPPEEVVFHIWEDASTSEQSSVPN